MAEPLLLEVKDLNIEFHDHLIPETVVYDFDLELKAGEIVGLVGESGSGKSMSALAIAGLLSRRDMHKKGQILFDGLDLLTCERSKLRKIQGNEISMIFQEPMTSLNPVKRIGWQIEESLRIHTELNKEERYQKAIEMMKEVELPDPERLYRQYPHELSGGQRQRVGIARALALNPKLIIADEPVSALDVSVQAQIINLLVKLQRELNLSYLFITHDLSVARYISNRIAVMYLGEIIEIGDKEEIFTNPKHPYTKALLEAVPSTDPERVQKNPVQISDLPSPLAPPSGCHYHTRCAMAMKCCATEKPAPVKISEDHQVCCHLYSAAKEQ